MTSGQQLYQACVWSIRLCSCCCVLSKCCQHVSSSAASFSHVCEPGGGAGFMDFPSGVYLLDHWAGMEKTAAWFILLLLSEAAGQGHGDPFESIWASVRPPVCIWLMFISMCECFELMSDAGVCWRRGDGRTGPGPPHLSERTVMTPGCHCLRVNDAQTLLDI